MAALTAAAPWSIPRSELDPAVFVTTPANAGEGGEEGENKQEGTAAATFLTPTRRHGDI